MKSFKSRRFLELQLTLVPRMDGSMQRPEEEASHPEL